VQRQLGNVAQPAGLRGRDRYGVRPDLSHQPIHGSHIGVRTRTLGGIRTSTLGGILIGSRLGSILARPIAGAVPVVGGVDGSVRRTV